MSQTHFRPWQQRKPATHENAVINNKSGLVIDFSFFFSRCRCSVLLESRRLRCQRAHKVQRRIESWIMLNVRMRDRENRGRRRRRKWRAVLTLWEKMCDAAEQQQQQQPGRLRDTGGAADVPAGPRSCGGGQRVNREAVCLSVWLSGWLSVWLSICLSGWLTGCLSFLWTSQDHRSLLTSSGQTMIVAE